MREAVARIARWLGS